MIPARLLDRAASRDLLVQYVEKIFLSYFLQLR